MTHARLSLNAMSTFPWPFAEDLALWRELGIRHAGLLMHKLDDDPEGKMQQLDDAGISASTLIVGSFDLAAPQSWEQTQAQHRTALDLMARHDGRSVYFTPGRTTGAPWREDMKRFAEAVAPTVSYARKVGISAAIEPSLRTSASFINTLRDAIDVSEQTGVKIVADFGNMWMERDFREVVAQAMPHIALMHICDVVIGGPGRPAPGGRVDLGDGELPLKRMMVDVLDAGYEGPFDLEVVPADFSRGCDSASVARGVRLASALLTEMRL